MLVLPPSPPLLPPLSSQVGSDNALVDRIVIDAPSPTLPGAPARLAHELLVLSKGWRDARGGASRA